MNIKKVKIALLAAICMTFTMVLNAQSTTKDKKGPSPDKMILKLDTNKDGKLSLEEMTVANNENVAKRFDRFDADKDGFLSEQEIAVMLEKRKHKRSEKQE